MNFIAPLLIALTLALPSYAHSEGPLSNEKNLIETKALTVQPATLEELRQADPLEIARLDQYDSRLYDIVTPIKKQQLNLCWSYATMAASETSILREGHFESPDRSLDLSELSHAYRVFNNDPAWDPLGLTLGDEYKGGYDRGYHLGGSAIKMLNWASPSFEPYWEPYPEVRPVDFLLEDIVRVDFKDIDDIKRAIARYGAVTVTYTINDWHEEYYYYNGNIRFPDGHSGDDHAVTIVGWDDTVGRDLYKLPSTLDGGWIVRNSWGTAHAEGDGYFMMSYDTPIWDVYAFDFAAKEEYDFNYHYDGFVDQEDVVMNNEPSASIFPAKKSSLGKQEFLKAVNVSVKDTEAPKKVGPGKIKAKIYTDVTANPSDIYSPINNPAPEGKLVAEVERDIDHEGSYTLKLPTPIELEKGSFFSVVVEVTSVNDKYKVALSSEPPTSSNDMTYYLNSEGKWVNCGFPSLRKVARIKAFTKLEDRVGEVEQDLRYAEMKIDPAFKPRYGAVPSRVDASLTSDGIALEEGVDFDLESPCVTPNPGVEETTSDYDVVATGILIAKGKGAWQGEARVEFPVLVGMHDLTTIGEVMSDNSILLQADGSHQCYGDIFLPEGWKFLFAEDRLQTGENTGNYVQYVGQDEVCYRRNMYPVIVNKTAEIPPKIDIASAEVLLQEKEFTYSGKAYSPTVVVRYQGELLSLNRDYRVQYRDNVNAGTSYVDIFGIGEYQGKKTTSFVITPASIAQAHISELKEATYTGEEIHPAVTLMFGEALLKEGEDYRLRYENAVNAGVATVIVEGIGNFQGQVEKKFEIKKAANEIHVVEIEDGTFMAESTFGEVIFKYYLDPDCQNEITIPTAPGTYYLKAFVEGNENYESAESDVFVFVIDGEHPGPSEPLPPEEDTPNEDENGWVSGVVIALVALGFIGGVALYLYLSKKKDKKE